MLKRSTKGAMSNWCCGAVDSVAVSRSQLQDVPGWAFAGSAAEVKGSSWSVRTRGLSVHLRWS
jgi:hypothetical protein